MAKQCHPDRNPGDKASEARFKEVNEAYEVLRDPQKKAAYDQFGHQAFEAGGMGGRGGAQGAGFDFTSFADVFDDLFGDFVGGNGGQRRGRSGATRGADLRYNLTICLEEAFAGKRAQIRVPTTVACEGCGGSGGEAGSEPAVCPDCRGSGRMRSQQGFFTVERTCLDLPGHRAGDQESRAGNAAAAVCSSARRPSRSTFRPASRTARASGSRARVRPRFAAASRAISTSSSPWRRTGCSAARVPT